MPGSLKRRDFIKAVSLAGTSLAVTNSVSAKTFLPPGDNVLIKNAYFTVSFNRKKGLIEVYRKNEVPLLQGATVCANLNRGKRCIASGGYKHSASLQTFTDQLGPGKRLIVFSKDAKKESDFELQLSLYDNLEIITAEAICRNVSRHNLVIKSLEPMRVIKNEGGLLSVPGVSKCITNGEMYYDTGIIHEFGKNDDYAVSSGNLKGVKLANSSISSQSETIHSWWNAGLFSGYEKEGIVLGYLENNLCLGNLLIAKTGAGEISFIAESVYAPEMIVEPGKDARSNRFIINIAQSPYKALENYADAMGKANNALTHSIVNGWCSWFYTLAQVSEDEVIQNTVFASEHLEQYGLEYIQIDEGYQRWHGDWEGNERFPHGMKWLADKIKSYGFKAGLWISPYVISEPTEVFQKHPEWLLKKTDGSLKRIGNWPENAQPPEDENPKRYGLDITHPEAAQWLYDLVDIIVHKWGYDMIKIDFVAWSVLAAERYYDPTLSSAQVYRKGMEIMRSAAGENCHILDCGPGAVTVGLIDSMRIEADVNYGFADAAWDTYFIHPDSSASATAKRYYFHKRARINDADHICMNLLNNQQAEAAATIIALSGGNIISGDRLTELDAYKLEILKKILPSFGQAATPVDLFDAEMQSVFAMKIKKQFGEWTIAAFFNPGLTETVEKKFSVQRLWLAPGKTYLLFDFWKQEFYGEIIDELKVTVQPGSVCLLSIHEKTGRPQFISTDRHALQGAAEIEEVDWNENTKTLSGVATGTLNTSYNIWVYVPDEHPWTWEGSGLFHDYDSYSVKLAGTNIIRVHVRFEKAPQVQWEIKTGEL